MMTIRRQAELVVAEMGRNSKVVAVRSMDAKRNLIVLRKIQANPPPLLPTLGL